MILRALCEVAWREGLLADPDYEPKGVAWIITLAENGRFLGCASTLAEQADQKKPRPKAIPVPRRVGRTSKPVADFLVDKSEYVLGIEPIDTRKPRKPQELAIRRELFSSAVRQAAEAVDAPGVKAVSRFLDQESERQCCAAELNKAGFSANDLFAFKYGGQFVHELPAVRQYFSGLRRQASGAGKAQCMLCGQACAPVDKHPGVQVRGGVTSGVALVSFNAPAYESYGWSRNENAPVCRGCADGYTTALTRLLSDRYPDPNRPGQVLPRRFVRISDDTTAVYWAEQDSAAIDLFSELFDAPTPEAVHALLAAPHGGSAPAALPPRFFCLIISGARGRAVLRGFHWSALPEVERNVQRWFQAIDVGTDAPLPLWALLRSLAGQGKTENLAPALVGDLFLAVLFGQPIARGVLAAAIQRCRSERRVPRERAALLRSYFIHNRVLEVSVGLDVGNTCVAYRMGRLLAVLERLQLGALNKPKKTIVECYYGAASTRPAMAFPTLLRRAQHHLAKLDAARWFQARLSEVLDGVEAFPPTLGMEDQGLFALGYYHQRQEFFKKKAEPAGVPAAASAPITTGASA